jgi:type IV secretory pathway TrbD component
MNLIDPRTVVILSGAMCGLMCLVYYSLRRKYPASIQGLSEWSLAMLLFCIGDALELIRK